MASTPENAGSPGSVPTGRVGASETFAASDNSVSDGGVTHLHVDTASPSQGGNVFGNVTRRGQLP